MNINFRPIGAFAKLCLGRLPFLLFYILLCLCSAPLAAQIEFVGGAHTLAKEDQLNHVNIYVLSTNSLSVNIKGPAGGELYRYTAKANDAVKVTDATLASDGMTWQMKDPVCDAGYFVRKEGEGTTYYWLIDYRSYRLPTLAVQARTTENLCSEVNLSWAEDLQEMRYHTPLGVPQALHRNMAIRYRTLRYDEKARSYNAQDTTVYIQPKGKSANIEASLSDTEYTIIGDAFNQPLGIVYQPLASDLYTAKRIEIHPYIDLVGKPQEEQTKQANTEGATNLSDASAPLDVHLKVVANEPVAALYNWIIYPTEKGPSAAILRFGGKDVDYTFDAAGKYTIALEVTNRDGSCSDKSFSQTIQIRESMLDAPNAFSPGSSPGVNDVFKVKYKSIVRFEASIFDRNGHRIYHWIDPAGGWDGHINGKVAPTGVYFYVISAMGADGEKYNLRGTVNVLNADQDNTNNNTDNHSPSKPSGIIN